MLVDYAVETQLLYSTRLGCRRVLRDTHEKARGPLGEYGFLGKSGFCVGFPTLCTQDTSGERGREIPRERPHGMDEKAWAAGAVKLDKARHDALRPYAECQVRAQSGRDLATFSTVSGQLV